MIVAIMLIIFNFTIMTIYGEEMELWQQISTVMGIVLAQLFAILSWIFHQEKVANLKQRVDDLENTILVMRNNGERE